MLGTSCFIRGTFGGVSSVFYDTGIDYTSVYCSVEVCDEASLIAQIRVRELGRFWIEHLTGTKQPRAMPGTQRHGFELVDQ